MIKKIVIIGSGNVATQFALAFQRVNIKIEQIISRNLKSGKFLANKINSLFSSKLKDLVKSDLIIICVNDDNIDSIVDELPDLPMIHTSGSTSIKIFKNRKNVGVIYPLQTLSTTIDTDFTTTPICVEGNNTFFEHELFILSQRISNKVFYINSDQRQNLHLSAVIASNFSNFCYLIAKKQLESKNIDFELIKPLILETAQKIIHTDPKIAQTGPAKRGDEKIIQKHLSILKDDNYKKIYKLLSNNILNEYGK